MNLERLARVLLVIKERTDQLEKRRARLRTKFFEGISETIEEHQLATDSITIPHEFWVATDMTEDEFFASRFPGWEVIHHQVDAPLSDTTYILRQLPEYVSGDVPVVGDEYTYRISKQVEAGKPEIDWDTLKAESPEAFKKLAQPVTTYEVSENGWNELMQTMSDFPTFIRRHTKVKSPTIKLFPRKVKNVAD